MLNSESSCRALSGVQKHLQHLKAELRIIHACQPIKVVLTQSTVFLFFFFPFHLLTIIWNQISNVDLKVHSLELWATINEWDFYGEMELLSSWPLNLILAHLLKRFTLLNFDILYEDYNLWDLFNQFWCFCH